MVKTFCDRCGKEITKQHRWITHRTLYARISLVPRKENTEWSNETDLYICQECEDSYVHWLLNPETETGR